MPLPTTVAEIPGHQARTRPDRVAIACEDRRVTYRELHEGSDRTAAALAADGVRPGSRVAYLGKESELYYDIAFGCAKAGAVLVPVNWRLTADEIDHVLRDSHTELLFVEDDQAAAVERVRADLPHLRHVVRLDGPGGRGAGFAAWRADRGDPPAVAVAPGAPFAQVYTSGTTGLPKGVVLSHGCFFALRDMEAEHGLGCYDWHDDDVSLVSLPGFNIAGLSWAVQGFAAGVRTVVMRMFVSQVALGLIREHRVSTTFVAPTMLAMLLAEPGACRESFASVRRIIYSGSPIAPSLLRRCLDTIDADFVQFYSATEAGNAVTALTAEEHRAGGRPLASAGRPCPGIEVRVVDQAGNDVAPGETGQIWVRSPAVMLGYWNQPETTARTLADGWLRMGDLGYLEDGYVHVLDRLNDTIIVAGQNVYPVEVENALLDHPAIAEAAVVGAPHERWGESVHAFVVVRAGAQVTPRQLLLSLRGRLADYKVPTGYEFMTELPRNPSGKVLRRSLRELRR